MMLCEFYGVGDLKQLILMYAEGFDKDLALYPVGIPISDRVVHD